MNYIIDGDMLKANVFGGFDYVFSQNYLDNACTNEFDSLVDMEGQPLVQQMLEAQIVSMYDSINETSQAYDYLRAQQDKNRKLESELRRMRMRNARRVQKSKQLDEDHFDSLICTDTINFDEACAEAKNFLNFRAPASENKSQNAKEAKAERYVNALGKIGGFGQ